jgi:hypothetical protein
MKTTEKMTETIVGAARELRFGHPNIPLSSARDKASLIQWTTERQIQEVSKKLAGINQVAIRSEVNGEYFKSGDLAYQIQEIIRATAELFKKSQQAKA